MLRIVQTEQVFLFADDATQVLTASVKPAYEALIAEMTAQEKVAGIDDGIWCFPDGAGYYAERLSNGAKYNVRVFHDTALKSGLVPLDVLEEQVDAWIASRK